MIATRVVSVALATLVAGVISSGPTPPEQPSEGPGGKAYSHASVAASRVGSGEQEACVFEPADPTPARAPVVVFGHGWGAVPPDIYGAWITHIVRRGFTVIYPRYQTNLRTPVADFTPNALASTTRALDVLRAPGHVTPDERGLAFVGHSMGGLIAANLAARAARGDLPRPLALMTVAPGRTWPQGASIAFALDDLSVLPATLLLVTLAGEDDGVVGDLDARRIYLEATGVPHANKDYVRMFSDARGATVLRANHRAPTAPGDLGLELGLDRSRDGFGRAVASDQGPMVTDALDYYGTWKILDGLLDTVFRGVHREYALGNTPEQRFMGHWSDRVPVRELVIGAP